MERKNIITEIGECMDVEIDYWNNNDTVDINDAQEFLADRKSLGATHIRFSGYSCEGSVDEVTMTPVNIRLESDDEYNHRVNTYNHDQAIIKRSVKQNELREYERLKEKYNL